MGDPRWGALLRSDLLASFSQIPVGDRYCHIEVIPQPNGLVRVNYFDPAAFSQESENVRDEAPETVETPEREVAIRALHTARNQAISRFRRAEADRYGAREIIDRERGRCQHAEGEMRELEIVLGLLECELEKYGVTGLVSLQPYHIVSPSLSPP